VVREPSESSGHDHAVNWPLNQIACKGRDNALADRRTMILKPSGIHGVVSVIFRGILTKPVCPEGTSST